tara:strand:- start:321 stop:812 length:492 start_codon:yes stop_codon:yes gene_type:complete
MNLSLGKHSDLQNQYLYTCPTKDCRFYLNTHLNTNHSFTRWEAWADGHDGENYIERSHPDGVTSPISCKDCINRAKINMLDILSHYVECHFHPCYQTLFALVIKPNLDNLDILKFFLQSTDTIKGFSRRNHNGYQMYAELLQKLSQVENRQIREFIRLENWNS